MILYATTNPGKFAEATLALAPRQLKQIELDIEEIQGSPQEIVLWKLNRAVEKVNQPVIVEDVTFEIKALGGFPGPYIKDFLQAIGEIGLWELARHYGNYQAATSCWVGYAEPQGRSQIFHGHIDGKIVAPRGSLKIGAVSYNSVFQPEGYEKTFGEMTMEEHAQCSHRGKALRMLDHWLGSEN